MRRFFFYALTLGLGLLVFLNPTVSLFGDTGAKRQKEICITFDDLPAAESFRDLDKHWITDEILGALRKHEVKAVGFVVTQNIGDGFDLLGQWLNAGHRLGNMTSSNEDLNDLDPDAFISSVRRAEDELAPILKGFGQKSRYFRYPFLHYGANPRAKQKVAGYLQEKGYTVAHVSIPIDDYLFNLGMENLPQPPDSVTFYRLQSEYVDHVLGAIVDADNLSRRLTGHSCRQVLRLRANLLNAWCLDDLLSSIEAMGYRFVTLDKALGDPIYSREESYYGSRGIGYLEMIAEGERFGKQ